MKQPGDMVGEIVVVVSPCCVWVWLVSLVVFVVALLWMRIQSWGVARRVFVVVIGSFVGLEVGSVVFVLVFVGIWTWNCCFRWKVHVLEVEVLGLV